MHELSSVHIDSVDETRCIKKLLVLEFDEDADLVVAVG